MSVEINEIAVLVGALLAIAVGSMWYSPLLFGPLWMRSRGKSFREEDDSKYAMLVVAIKGILVQVVSFFIITYFISMSTELGVSLLKIGLLLTAFLGVQMMSLIVWEGRPLSYVFVHLGYSTIVLFGGIGIIAYWPW